MSKKELINKKIAPQCEYCLYSTYFAGNNELLCRYKGVISAMDSCRKFKYDILKRTPHKQTLGNDYAADDFKL